MSLHLFSTHITYYIYMYIYTYIFTVSIHMDLNTSICVWGEFDTHTCVYHICCVCRSVCWRVFQPLVRTPTLILSDTRAFPGCFLCFVVDFASIPTDIGCARATVRACAQALKHRGRHRHLYSHARGHTSGAAAQEYHVRAGCARLHQNTYTHMNMHMYT